MEGMPSKRKTMRQTLRNSIAAAGALLWSQSDTSVMAQTLTTTQEVQKHTMSLTQKLAPGGSWNKKLHDVNLNKEDVINLIKEEIPLTNALQKSWNEEKWGGAKNFGMYTVFHQIPGLAVHTFEYQATSGLHENAKLNEADSCNGQFIRDVATDITLFETSYHCIQHAAPHIKSQFTFDLDSDIAIKRVPDYKGPALLIDSSKEQKPLKPGTVACVVGYKNGENFEINNMEAHCGILNPMTKEVYPIFMGQEPQNDYLDRSIRDGFWTVFPFEIGARESEANIPKIQGFSGSVVAAYDPATKMWSRVGRFSSVLKNKKDEKTGNYPWPATIAFITTQEQFKKVFKLEQLRYANEEARKEATQKTQRPPRFGDQVITRVESVEQVLHKVQSKTESPWKTTVKVRKKNS